MINRTGYLFLIVNFIILASCKQEYQFDYKILDGDTDISKLPFSNNQNLNSEFDNKIDYHLINDSIYTSIYIAAHAGCSGTAIIPKIRKDNGKLILSISINKNLFTRSCLLNIIQLNYRIKNSSYVAVYYSNN